MPEWVREESYEVVAKRLGRGIQGPLTEGRSILAIIA